MVDVPEAVRRKARVLGAAGEQWLAELPAVVRGFERDWGIRAGAALVGGSAAYVAEAVTADGVDAVLKIAIPDGLSGNSPFARELQALRAGAGRGYVSVLRVDEPRRVMVQERLGRSLDSVGLSVEAQIDVITATLAPTWVRAPAAEIFETGAEQAASLDEFMQALGAELRELCPAATITQARRYTRTRRDAFDASTAVVIHGDAHPANILEAPDRSSAPSGFKLIDPDGMVSEPAHDLGIPLRDWSDELLAGDPVALGLAWCARLSANSGVDGRAIWEWAFTERVSTGLFMLSLGDPHGARLLEVAARWTGVEP